jgi:hypothetical protein
MDKEWVFQLVSEYKYCSISDPEAHINMLFNLDYFFKWCGFITLHGLFMPDVQYFIVE